MSHTYDKSQYYIDYSKSTTLTDDEKAALEKIQEIYRPVERAELLTEYRVTGKISDDDYSYMTSIPIQF